MITNETILRSARHAGGVKRFHTWPVLKEQTVAEHTFHCLRLYNQIFGPLPPEVSTYLIWHDLGEIKLGDLPYPSKANNPDLKAAADRVEAQARIDLGAPEVELDDALKARCKLVDLIEMLEYGIIEMQYGNTWAYPVTVNMGTAVAKLLESFPEEDKQLVTAYLSKAAREGV